MQFYVEVIFISIHIELNSSINVATEKNIMNGDSII